MQVAVGMAGRPGPIGAMIHRLGALRREVADGVLVAEAGVRMAVKNRIIVETVGTSIPFDADHVALFARGQLGRLRQEMVASSARMRDSQRDAAFVPGQALHQHDYRWRDEPILRRRRRVYDRVAVQLKRRQDDRDWVLALVEEARAAAWAEVGAEVRRTLQRIGGTRGRPALSEDDRIVQIAMIGALDLPRLAEDRGVDLPAE